MKIYMKFLQFVFTGSNYNLFSFDSNKYEFQIQSICKISFETAEKINLLNQVIVLGSSDVNMI